MLLATCSRRARLHLCNIYLTRECASIAERFLFNRNFGEISYIMKKSCRPAALLIYYILLPPIFAEKRYLSCFAILSEQIFIHLFCVFRIVIIIQIVFTFFRLYRFRKFFLAKARVNLCSFCCRKQLFCKLL